jgi:hypothetical protein
MFKYGSTFGGSGEAAWCVSGSFGGVVATGSVYGERKGESDQLGHNSDKTSP